MINKSPYLIFLSFLLLLACNPEQKGLRYKNIYQEKPDVIFIAPIKDYLKPKNEKEREANRYNSELIVSKILLRKDLIDKMNSKGYYSIPLFSSAEIDKLELQSAKSSPLDSSTTVFSEKYGIDAILYTSLLRWKELEDEWIVYMEYILKSTKTNEVLFHARTKGVKYITRNKRGFITIAPYDKRQADDFSEDARTANRLILYSHLNSYVIKNIPYGKSHKNFETDNAKSAIPKYIEYKIDDLGTISIKTILLEQFEQECFLDE